MNYRMFCQGQTFLLQNFIVAFTRTNFLIRTKKLLNQEDS